MSLRIVESTDRPALNNPADHESFTIPFQTLRVIFALFVRELTTSYGRTQLGFLWAIFEPLGGIMVLSLGFSMIFKTPALGESFLMFYATGYLPYSLYVKLNSQISVSIRQNKTLLFYPAVTYFDVIVARFILISLIELIVMVFVLGGIIVTQKTGVVVRYDMIFLALFLCMMLGTGVGIVNAVMFERIPAWRSVWQIFNRPMFFVSGVMFIVDSLPEFAKNVFLWNPLLHVIGYFRKGFYGGYEGAYLSWIYPAGIGLFLMAIGLMMMRQYNKFIINN